MKHLLAALLLGSFALTACNAAPSSPKTVAVASAKYASVANAAVVVAPIASDEAAVRRGVALLAPHAKIDRIRPAPIAGLSEVSVDGQLLYVTSDGKYIVSGNIIQIAGKVDLTEQAHAAIRREAFKAITPAQTIVFAPPNPKYTVNVFTDVDCGYCRKLHSQIADYNREGIAVRYLFFPRTGIGSESYNKAVAVWCAPDRRRALTDAKAGMPVIPKNCNNPVTMDYNLGLRVGVDGTPAIYTMDGVQIGGYVSPVEMRQKLEKLATQARS